MKNLNMNFRFFCFSLVMDDFLLSANGACECSETEWLEKSTSHCEQSEAIQIVIKLVY